MKKYFNISIISFLLFTSFLLGSCGEDKDTDFYVRFAVDSFSNDWRFGAEGFADELPFGAYDEGTEYKLIIFGSAKAASSTGAWTALRIAYNGPIPGTSSSQFSIMYWENGSLFEDELSGQVTVSNLGAVGSSIEGSFSLVMSNSSLMEVKSLTDGSFCVLRVDSDTIPL